MKIQSLSLKVFPLIAMAPAASKFDVTRTLLGMHQSYSVPIVLVVIAGVMWGSVVASVWHSVQWRVVVEYGISSFIKGTLIFYWDSTWCPINTWCKLYISIMLNIWKLAFCLQPLSLSITVFSLFLSRVSLSHLSISPLFCSGLSSMSISLLFLI